MKKILAIMLIAVIAVAGVFAVDVNVTGPTGVKLTYTIDELWKPAINLTATSYDAVTSGTEVTAIQTKTSGDKNLNSFAAGSNSDGFKAGRVDFQILDLTKVNSTSAHDITISYTCTKWLNSSNVEKHDITDSGKITANFGAPGSEAAKTTQSNVNTNNLKIAYAANTIIDRTTSTPEVGTFSVSWVASSQLAAGEYHADVVLTLTAN